MTDDTRRASDPKPFPADLVPTVIFEDTHLVVVSKPAGLLAQGESTGDVNLVDWCRGYFGRNYVGLVHRLDRNTSGMMVVAKRSKAADRLSEALREGTLIRVYRALVHGRIASPVEWRHWLKKDERTNTSTVVRAGTPGAKEAGLRAVPVEARTIGTSEVTLVEFHLETGRSHQIRVQSAASGHALLGDTKYGGRESSAGAPAFPRPALHSFRLEFPHPMTKEILRFEDPVPADFKTLWGNQ
jgi:23S rRNA pseudouridine1911/1915/1917 synthase